MKAEVDKLDIAKLVNVPFSLNNLKTKLDDLDTGKLKSVPVPIEKINVLQIKNLLKHKIQHIKNKSKWKIWKTPKATNLIHTNQYNTDKQSLEKLNWRN